MFAIFIKKNRRSRIHSITRTVHKTAPATDSRRFESKNQKRAQNIFHFDALPVLHI